MNRTYADKYKCLEYMPNNKNNIEDHTNVLKAEIPRKKTYQTLLAIAGNEDFNNYYSGTNAELHYINNIIKQRNLESRKKRKGKH